MGELELKCCEKHRVKRGETLEKIARSAGLGWADLARYNFGTTDPRRVNACLRAMVGCKRRDAGGNYVFDDADEPGVIFVPRPAKELALEAGRRSRIRATLPRFWTPIEVETLDLRGHPVAGVKLLLVPQGGGAVVKLETDADGHAMLPKVNAGRYVAHLEGDGGRVFFAKGLPPAAAAKGELELVPAVIDTTEIEPITSVVVPRELPAEEREHRRLLKKLHLPADRPPPPPQGDDLDEQMPLRGPAAREMRAVRLCCDNLAIAAGWKDDEFREIDVDALVHRVLPGFLKARCPTLGKRGHAVAILRSPSLTLSLYGDNGDVQATLRADNANVRAFVGAYAIYEDPRGRRLADIATRTYDFNIYGTRPDGSTATGDLYDLVSDPDRLSDWELRNAGKRFVLLYLPTGRQLFNMALHGGCGKLEDYTGTSLDDEIHARNLRACRSFARAYEYYREKLYVRWVRRCEDEDDLRALGPPLPPYQPPSPARSTPQQVRDVFNAGVASELDAWVAIGQRLDRIQGRKTEGLPFLRFKLKYEVDKGAKKFLGWIRPDLAETAGKIPVALEVEGNLDLQLDSDGIRVITQDSKWKTEIKLKKTFDDSPLRALTGGKTPVEISVKGPAKAVGDLVERVTDGKRSPIPPDTSLTVKIGPYEMKTTPTGKMKLSLQEGVINVDTEVDPHSAEMSGGVTLKFKWLAEKLKGRGPLAEKWAKRLDGLEIGMALGFVGLREETALAVVSYAPGFFERRPLEDLLAPATRWNALSLHEQGSLVALGWTPDTWDYRYEKSWEDHRPKSWKKHWSELDAREKVAIVHLGFRAYEEYGQRMKIAFLRYTR